MRSQLKKSFALAAINSGVLLTALLMNQANASDCGQAKLLTAGSVGVNVSKNACKDSNRIALGSTLELAVGSRMWLKFDTDAKGETVQLICQNKSQDSVKVNLTATTEPWIKTDGVKNCTSWQNKKLSCENSEGEKNSFFCVIAATKSDSASTSPQMTTSVKLRGGNLKPISADDVIESLKPDIELCKSLYNVTDKVEMSWTVSIGKIHDLTVDSDNKDLVSCVEDVVKQANANQDLSIKHAF